MRLGCANIKNYPDMPRSKVVADAREMAELCDVWGQQENDPDEDDDAISPALGDEWGKVHGGTNLPLWFRKAEARVVDRQKIRSPLEPDLPLVAKPRWITGTTLELRERKSLPGFVIVNVHMIAGGMNGDRIPARARQWSIEWATVKEFVGDYRRQGFTVFVLGDFNNPSPPKPARAFDWLVGERLDRIGVTTAGSVVVDETADGSVQLNSDHRGLWTRVHLTPR